MTETGNGRRNAFDRREPTSHERMTGVPWDASYADGPAPWDIGRPQPAIVRLASEGRMIGPVLDAGCGSGENTLHIAALGVEVLGVDVAETALQRARRAAADRALAAEFAVADAFHLDRLQRTFHTVLDCGLFHTFDADERDRYAASLARVVAPQGSVYILCFSDEGPETGPHPIRRGDITAAFPPAGGWEVRAVERERVHTRFLANGAPAWLATVIRR